MAEYRFETHFHLRTSPERIHAAVMEPEPWLQGEPHVRRLHRVREGDLDGVGRCFAVEMRAVSPYRLRCQIEVTEVDAPHRIRWRSHGDLAGHGDWQLTARGGGTGVCFRWEVRTTPLWMNLVAAVARPLFVWNHDRAMAQAADALGAAVGSPVDDFRVRDRAARGRTGP